MNAFTVQDAPLNMAPTGIATFAKVPICYDIHHANADIAILGAPFDLAIQGKTGCRLGPRGIRNASTRFRMKKGGNYDPERNKSYLDTDLWRVAIASVLVMRPDHKRLSRYRNPKHRL